MTTSVIQPIFLAIFFIGSEVSHAQSLTKDLPPACGDCTGKGAIAIGPFSLEAGLLVKSVLPAASGGDVREEPWVFDLVVTKEGKPCMVRRSSGPPGSFADQLFDNVMRWRFMPWIHNGRPMCLRSLLFFYVRNEHNKIVVRVPGVTEPF